MSTIGLISRQGQDWTPGRAVVRPLWPDCDDLRASTPSSHARPNEEILVEGDEADRVIEVVEGVVRLCKVLSDGRRLIVEFLYPGDVFGLTIGDTYTATAEAVTHVRLRSYPRASIEAQLDGALAFRRWLSNLMSRELQAAQERILLLGRKHAMERLASFVLALARRQSAGDRRRVHLVMSRLDIADYLGLTIETVSRLFTEMRTKGLIALPTPQEVVILRPAALAQLAGDGFVDDSGHATPWPEPSRAA
jgi:CRP/FNR family transcriptional regulator